MVRAAGLRPLARASVQQGSRGCSGAGIGGGEVQHRSGHRIESPIQGSGAFGNAATRVEAFIYSQGNNSFIQDPQIDAWYRQQATERDRQKREAMLHQIQQKVYEDVRFLPI
jgi:peptide/nickel transport system substrate-binding protein